MPETKQPTLSPHSIPALLTSRRDSLQTLKPYLFASGISALLLMLGVGLSAFIPKDIALFLLISSIVMSVWYASFSSGLLATVVTTIGAGYFLFHISGTAKDAQSVTALLIFLLVGIFVSFMMHVSKKENLEREQQYEQKEQQYFRELEKIHKEYLVAKEEIKARDEFLSIASHELKTPLTSMMLQLQTALHNIRNVSLANFSVENLMKMLESAEQQSDRVTRMINDLLDTSLITTGKIDLEPAQTDLGQLVHNVINHFTTKLEKEGIPLQSHLEKDVVAHVDPLRIEQVVTNLLTNAMKYGDHKPIEVYVRKENHLGKIIVADHGIGIPEEQQTKIFARFERVATSSHFKGLGVGLYITHQIVAAHNGKIKVSSKPQYGSIFTIELPLSSD